MCIFRLFAIFALAVCGKLLFQPQVEAADEPAKETVKLIVDYGDGSQKHFTTLAWKKEMTIHDLLLAAAKHPRGIRIETRGAGETMFLTKIDDLKNEGRHLNWLFFVNGKVGETSCAIHKLQAGDSVLWKFGESRYNP